MKKFLLIIFALTTSFSFSQKCKYVKNEVDEFTNKKILETKGEVLTISGMGFGFSCAVSFKKVDNDRFMLIHITNPSIVALKKGDALMLKTNESSPIELKFSENVVSDYISGTVIGNSRTPSMHSLKTYISLSEDDYNRLINEEISKARIYTTDGYVDDDVKAKRAKNIKAIALCIQ